MIDVFKEVRERVSAEDAARHYGIEVKHRKALCPFHSERTASLSFKGGRYHCFGCGAGGDSIDFTARLLSLDPLGAVRELNRAFALCLPLDREPTEEERRAAQRRRDVADTYRAFERWRTDTIYRLNACFREAHLLRISSLDRLSEREALALREQATVEYYSAILSQGTLAEQVAIFRTRKEVERLCKRILPSTPTRSGAA